MRQKNMKRHVLNTGYGLFLLILACPLWACSYEEGRSYYRAKQYEKAHACFMQPENRQNPKAWNTLGIMYNNGYGVEKDERKAVEWYMKAAMNGYAVSQYNLACQYEKGRGVERDYARAMFWYEKAAEQNDSSAELNIGYLYSEGIGVPRDMQKALYWYRRAAAHGDTDAMTNIAHMYYQGTGLKRDINRAMQYYIMAAEKDHPRA